MQPDLSRVPQFYHNYINHVPQDDLMEAFRVQTPITMNFFEALPSQKHDYRYAAGKWTIKEVIQHIIDAERVFTYRALCFARKDKTFLPAFDENSYADHSKGHQRNWTNMLEEFRSLRTATEYLFGSFDAEQLDETGTSNNNSIYVLGVGYIVIGHAMHHIKVIKERYL
ncbi:MAG: DinB family protein [Chitinophagaceae bacterium]|nr:DinB family protein [Chitinophagaceae bacterium]